MSEIKLSTRAKLVFEWVENTCHPGEGQGLDAGLRQHDIMIRQQTLADKFGCSRRSIYRALKELKEQGYLVETK
ncbi:MAG: helix-turn-helix domain-containing protein, partial [Deltaproteobacteria bacterium]|nr:helix-turn-helix domain-containing protein [Deltaproteobacteria bacterium]